MSTELRKIRISKGRKRAEDRQRSRAKQRKDLSIDEYFKEKKKK